MLQALLGALDADRLQQFVGKDLRDGGQGIRPRRQPPDDGVVPDDAALFGEIDLAVISGIELLHPLGKLGGDRRGAGRAQGGGMNALGPLVRLEAQALDPAHMLALDHDGAVFLDCGHQLLLLFQPLHQYAGAAVDKSLRQSRMQGVGKSILHRARAFPPMAGIIKPIRPVRCIGPCADIGQSLRKHVYIAIGLVDSQDLLCHPVGRDDARTRRQEAEDAAQQVHMLADHGLAEIRDLADIPEQMHRLAALDRHLHVRIGGKHAQGHHVLGLAGALQAGARRGKFEAGQQGGGGGELQARIAPLQRADGREAVILDILDDFRIERAAIGGDAEAAVVLVAARPARDLGEFLRLEIAVLAPVELGLAREPDGFEVEIQAHADGIGRDEVFDLALLEHLHLRIAGAGRERAHHDRRAALLSPDQFRDGIDLIGGEGDDGGSLGQTADLLRSGIGEDRVPLADMEACLRDQLLDPLAHGHRAEEQGFVHAARIEQPVGEDVAALRVGAELDLVHREEGCPGFDRHRFDGADEVFRVRRDDLFLARDQRHHGRPAQLHHPVIDFPREQAQGKAHDAGLVTQHPLDGIGGLAGIGGAEYRRDGMVPRMRSGHERAASCRGLVVVHT